MKGLKDKHVEESAEAQLDPDAEYNNYFSMKLFFFYVLEIQYVVFA